MNRNVQNAEILRAMRSLSVTVGQYVKTRDEGVLTLALDDLQALSKTLEIDGGKQINSTYSNMRK